MLKIKIICLGKFKDKGLASIEQDYLKRMRPFAKIKLVELPEVPYRSNDDLDRVKQKEAAVISKHLTAGAIVILLEEKGTLRNSLDFANFLERLGGLGQEIIFVLGSGIGLHKSLHELSNYQVSLSPLTFPHNIARVLLEEQIYRAGTIIAKKEYHK